MNATGLILLLTGALLLLGSLAYPEGEKEEQAFMTSAQQRENVMEHGSDTPATPSQTEKENAQHQEYTDKVIIKSEHFLYAGIVLVLIGTTLLAVRMTGKK